MDDEIKNKDQDEATQGSENEVEKLQKERDEYLNGWQRAKADLINYKKDEAKRFSEMSKYSNEMLIRDLLFVLDSFDLAISALEKDGHLEKGIYLIKAQLEDVLKNYGLTKVHVEVGQQFDPMVAEAVTAVESDQGSGTIVEIVDFGYYLNDKLVRPARVKVAK